MRNRMFEKCVCTVAALSVSYSVCAKNEHKDERPNIVVFIADDAGMDYGCYGNKNISTPNIDKLAKNGMLFQKAFLTSPQSSPSRTSMMTGMFAHTIGTQDLHTGIDGETKMMPYYFKQAGYNTACMLKTHWGPNGDKQFDQIIKGGYLPDQGPLNKELFVNYSHFLDETKDAPFFLWVGFIDPHRPYNRNKCEQVNSPDKVTVPPYLVDAPDTRRDLADYYNEISRMDGDMGKMIAELEKRGLMENTIVVFLSDNGMPFPRAKGTLYDSGIQTPLVFMWNHKIKPGTKHSNGLVSTIDLAPTLLDLAGIEIPGHMYGSGFKELLFDNFKRGSEFVFSERNWHDTDEYIRSVRSEKYKLIYNAYYELPHGTSMDLSTSLSWYDLKKEQREGRLKKEQNQVFQCPRAMVEIYDLETDPNELDNVADKAEYREPGRKLADRMVEWQKKTNDDPWWKNRRGDQNDRITGFPLFMTRPPLWVD